jgi:Cu-Zn family superoxide dismutase
MLRTSTLAALCSACWACATAGGQAGPPGAVKSSGAARAISSSTGLAATAVIEPRSGSALGGTARFVDVAGGLGARVEVHGAAPGLHGVHIHEKGNCSAPDASSAGGHFNPAGAAHHGGPATDVRHGGDLGNIEVDASGAGRLDVIVGGLTVNSLLDGVVGRSIVVHEKADDLHSDPAGNSGARVGCGVIEAPPVGDM